MKDDKFNLSMICATVICVMFIGAQCQMATPQTIQPVTPNTAQYGVKAPKVGDCTKDIMGSGQWTYQEDRGCWMKTKEL